MSKRPSKQHFGTPVPVVSASLVLILAPASGCQQAPPKPFQRTSAPPASRPVSGAGSYPMLINGTPVTWPELGPTMAELSGRAAVEEITLDRALARRLDALNLTVTEEMISAEAERLDEGIPPGLEPSAFRSARGLGPVRYPAALRRTAGLRAIVIAEDSPVLRPTPVEIDLELAIRSAEARRLRMITCASERTAAELHTKIAAAPPPYREAETALAAIQSSLGPAVAAGGLVPALSLADPTVPAGLRDVLSRTPAGELTPVVATDEGFAFALVVEVFPATEPTEADREALLLDLERRAERQAMDRLAQRLIRESDATVLSPSLDWGLKPIDQR